MRIAILGMLALLLSACAGYRATEFYTKPEVDAINAETQCRNLARTLVQMQRCGLPR